MVKTPAAVPRLWPESTIVCIASGPSLTRDDVEFCRGRARVVVVNDGFRLAPWADVLYAADAHWWRHHQAAHTFAGLKFGMRGARVKGVAELNDLGVSGLSEDPTGLRTGRNSGYQAIGLAVHLGAKQIVLLGYDLHNSKGQSHWFGSHPTGLRETNPSLYSQWLGHFSTLVAPLAKRGITIVNCSRQTALTCFPRQALADVLPDRLEAAS